MKDTLDIIREYNGFPTSASKDTLLPCPFCGGKAEVQIVASNFCVACTECQGCIWPCNGQTRAEAIEAWNRRAE